MKKIQETVIITVSMIGMAETGTGTATFEIDPNDRDVARQAVEMKSALSKALGAAMLEVSDEFNQYIREKYQDEDVDKPDAS